MPLCVSAPVRRSLIWKEVTRIDACKSAIFAFASFLHILQEFGAKKHFTEHEIPNTIQDFGDSVLVYKMHNCYCRIRKVSSNIPFFPIQAMQTITMDGLE